MMGMPGLLAWGSSAWDSASRHGQSVTEIPLGAPLGEHRRQSGQQTRAFDGCDVRPRRSGFVATPNHPFWGDDMAVTTERSADAVAIRPFTIEVPEKDLEDLRARLAAT